MGRSHPRVFTFNHAANQLLPTPQRPGCFPRNYCEPSGRVVYDVYIIQGHILACNTAFLLYRMMYWTSQSPGSIQKAGMDGSSPVTIVTGLNLPRGLAIDFAARRLYWADMNDNRIQTSDLDGRGFRTVVQLPGDRYPWGIAVSKDRIYFGNNDSDGNNRLQSCTKDGQDIETLYTQDTHIRHMVLLPAVDRPTNRKNHCEGQNCSMLCVLSQTSYRCLA